MRISSVLVALVVVLTLPLVARADLDETDPPVVPTLALGLGGAFPMAPRTDAHVVGSAMLGLQARIGAIEHGRISALVDLGYSGDRRGYLAGRHFVLGTGLRYGSVFGASYLVQGAFGRTLTERSFAFRMGGRFDVRNYLGFVVLFEARHVMEGPDAGLVGRGMRFELFFDPLRFAYRISQLGRAVSRL